MGRGIDNYFLILELDFKKPESDPTVIKQRIKDKAKFWNTLTERGRMQQKYRQYKSQISVIQKVMDDDALRTAEAKDAMTFVQGILKEELKFFSDSKEIEEAAAKEIMEKCGLWPEMFETLTGKKIVAKKKKEEIPIEDPNPKTDKHDKFNKHIIDLKVVRKENLYDFLADNATTDIIGLQNLDGEELIRSYSDPIKKRLQYDKSEEAVSSRNLCAACEEIFGKKDPQLRVKYDKYLIWQKKDSVISRMDKYSGTDKVLNESQQKLFIDELTQIVRNREEAVKIYKQICAFKGISSKVDASNEKNDKLVACGHCFTMVDISKGGRNCSNCGRDLYIKCPECGKEVLASANACTHCGFILENLQKVESLCSMAKTAIANMDFAKARSNLAKAKELMSGYERIAVLNKELQAKESVFSKEVSQLSELVKNRAFYKALSVLKSLQAKAPTAKIANDVLIENSVKDAELLYKSAVGETSEAKLVSICSQITNICADYPGVEALMLKYRPKAPTNVRIVCDNATCTNTITWDQSTSAGEIYYKVIRKENTAAASISDPAAVVVAEAGSPKCIDTKVKPGVNYYYSIYTMRAGVASNAVYANAVNIAQIRVTGRKEGDGFIRIEWAPLESNAVVNAYRRKDTPPVGVGDGDRIPVSTSYLMDDTIENDVKYYYLLNVVYHIDGKNHTSETVVGPFIATSLPDPIDDLTITSLEDDLFEAQWTNSGKEKVTLYYTTGRCSLKYGDITNIKKVTEQLKPVDAVSYSAASCKFRISDNAKYAIIPVITKYNTAIIGEQALAAKIEKLKVESTELINSDIRIAVKWPEDAVSVLVIYGNDKYAKTMEDRKGKTVRNISKKQYLADTGLYIKNIEQKDYYITLYSATRLNGETVYSDGTQILFSNSPKADIQYAIRTKGFLMNKQIEVEFSSSINAFQLPDIDLVIKMGSMPVYASTGTTIQHIPAQAVQGSLKVTFPVNSVPKSSYLKAFFTDEDTHDEITLRPAYGTNFKIS